MEKKISIFENFALISVVMPYYSYAHNAFLLLSSLCSASRNKLDEFYEEFRYSMRKNLLVLSHKEGRDAFKLPNDIFAFHDLTIDNEQIDNFVKYVKNLILKEGHYFNSHYMSKHICIDCVNINLEQIEDIYSFVNDMKAIKIFKSNYTHDTCSFIDT